MTLFEKLKKFFIHKKTSPQNVSSTTMSHKVPPYNINVTTVPPDVQEMITYAREKFPELSGVPDEQVAQLILDALEEEQNIPPSEVDTATMSAHECGVYGEQLLNNGNWQEAERFFGEQLEKGKQENDLNQQMKASIELGRLSRDRGYFELEHVVCSLTL